MDAAELTSNLKRSAIELGFSLVGLTPAVSPAGAKRLGDWLAAGYAGEMHYIADRRDVYADPRQVLDGARSIVMLAIEYRTAEPVFPRAGEGRISRYAWGAVDYHDLVRERLNRLADMLRDWRPEARARGVVDTAPILEREFAQLAGLGWIGKHTLLINRHQGSWFFLAALLTDIELEYDASHETDHCGTCRACLDACPTDAFPQPYVLDASRCISYLTIELKDAIPEALRSGVGEWLFGCDVCQEVCPWNSRSEQSSHSEFAPLEGNNPVELSALFEMEEAAFRKRFRHTPLWRPKRRGILRNAAIVLGNQRATAALPALIRGLNDHESLVRGACAWALGRFAEVEAENALRTRSRVEQDASVSAEIEAALASRD